MTGLLVFAITYVLIASRRLAWLPLDRPAVVWLGAVAMVALGVLSPDAALQAVDIRTLLLLLAVMGIGAFLELDGFFDAAEGWLARHAPGPAALLTGTVWGSGLLAALVTNDAVAVLATPVVARIAARRGLPAEPYLLALALSVNTGSAATLVGNPQNMLCAGLGELSYRTYLLQALPVAVVGLAIGHGAVWWRYRDQLQAPPTETSPPPPTARAGLTLAGIAAAVTAAIAGYDLAWTMATAFAVLMVAHRRRTQELWPRLDWPLLLFFAGLFVVVEGLRATGLPDVAFATLPVAEQGPTAFAVLVLLGSNLVSNVPFILVVADELLGEARWTLLAVVSTLAGNLTLVGSVANLIVASGGGIPFASHARLGVPVTLLSTAFAVWWLG